ncbi:MAG: polysaccharide deacetylase family protein, partial [Sedimentisphaerales bacterium]
MKKINKILLLAVFLAAGNVGYSKMIDSPYEVATWKGFRKAAICYTFDDGNSNQFAIALPMFDEFGFKMTLFTVSDWATEHKNWDALKTAASEGHEVASHTVTHPSLDRLSKERQDIELKNSKEVIEANIPDQNCITIAYPNCRPGDLSICKKYYIAAR